MSTWQEVDLGALLSGPPLRGDWGPWRLDPDRRVLDLPMPDGHGCRYEVDLDKCTSSAQVLDWLCQVAGKRWADDATLAGLVRALDDILHPQATLCSGGRGRQLSHHELVRRVTEAATAVPEGAP